MKKSIMIAAIALIGLALLSASGKEEELLAPQRGFYAGETPEILTLEGTLEAGDYGHLQVAHGDSYYLLGMLEMYNPELIDEYLGSTVEMEGFEGPTVYTKDKAEYQMFHPLKVRINGEELDLGGLAYGGFGMRGGNRMMGRAYCLDDESAYAPMSGRGNSGRGSRGNFRGGPMMGGIRWNSDDSNQ